MVKLPSLTSLAVESVTLVTRMRACVVAAPATTHGCDPSFGVFAAIDDHDVPPLRDTSMFTFPVSPLDVH
jgi:hypothetical protein